ncbi:MAG: PSD1 and planctomycete cytochrome C domain-containing protein [Pirellulaceae bacterium]|nr:PSD1 and planctomycete cytochrome C domain-containing protein [Pirellulaceae bacterium]
MTSFPTKIFFATMMVIAMLDGAIGGDADSSKDLEFFEKQVRPALATHCFECHSHQAEKLKAGLLLDSRAGMLRGGDSGPAIVPKDAQASMLIRSIHYDEYEMPPKGKLSDADIRVFETWIEHGAFWPDEPEPTSEKSKPAFDLQARKVTHWVWQPIVQPKVPTVADTIWLKNDIDAFILNKLEQSGIKPASPVDRRGLLRRLYFDLIGLPPTPEQVKEFLDDESTDALENVVDQLLESPHFGERWGRHWLDLVRYAESRGHEFDSDANNAYQYRDYIIRAFNADVPYDQLVREHIAGDLIAEPRLNPDSGFNESVLGTGFWFFGEWAHSPVDIRKDETDRFDNMIDVMSKTFLGVTLACARCHDHKFDAISSRDYYALSGFLQSSDYRQVRFESIEDERQVAVELDKIDDEYRTRLITKLGSLLDDVVDQDDSCSEIQSGNAIQWSYKNAPPSDFRMLVDYRELGEQDYLQDGFIFGNRPTRAGDLVIDFDKNKAKLSLAALSSARNDPFWNGLVNRSEAVTQSNSGLDFKLRSGRTLRSPSVEIQNGTIHLQVRGSGLIVACVDSHRQVGGPLHNETILKIKPEGGKNAESSSVRWHVMKLARYKGHRIHFEFTPSEDSVLEVVQVVESSEQIESVVEPSDDQKADDADKKDSEKTDNAVQSDSSGDMNETCDAACETRAVARDALDAWQSGQLYQQSEAANSVQVLQQLLDRHINRSDSKQPDAIACRKIADEWSKKRQSLKKRWNHESQLAMAMLDGSGEDDHVLIRGSADNPGNGVPRRFLEAIDGDNALPMHSRSGRLELADRINDAKNPLTARVIVNRIWHHLFGRGIVPTTDDFGVLGQLPTHPELLDYLAASFRRDGQSIKKTIRTIVLSQLYQCSSNIDGKAIEQDPKNLLWHYMFPKRLEGEVTRDALLMVAGNLSSELYGPSIPIHLTDFMDGRGRPKESGPIDGDGRRSIYIAVRRNFLSPFMLAFDTPSPFSTMGRRNVSNVPAQALILMNDPFVADQARGFAKRAIEQCRDSESERVVWLYESAFARPPEPREMELAIEFVLRQAEMRAMKSNDPSIWTDLSHALINTKEFIYLR